jgi:hypothetical protein
MMPLKHQVKNIDQKTELVGIKYFIRITHVVQENVNHLSGALSGL